MTNITITITIDGETVAQPGLDEAAYRKGYAGGVKTGEHVRDELRAQLNDALAKLDEALYPDDIRLYTYIKRDNGEDGILNTIIEYALDTGHRMYITYQDGEGETTERMIRVEMGKTTASGSFEYIKAYCFHRGEHRTFLLSRIEQAQLVRKGLGA